jgi:hypothetical protein
MLVQLPTRCRHITVQCPSDDGLGVLSSFLLSLAMFSHFAVDVLGLLFHLILRACVMAIVPLRCIPVLVD